MSLEPRYDSVGNWPWTHPVEGGCADSRYSYAYTSLRRRSKCLGLARRRVGRGGRLLFDRAWTQFEKYDGCADAEGFSQCPPNGLISMQQDRVPPWPHFKPTADSSDDDDDCVSTRRPFLASWTRYERDCDPNLASRPALQRSFSTQPTSRFRVHPYPSRRNSINNQVFLASLAATFSAKSSDPVHLIIKRPKSVDTRAMDPHLSTTSYSLCSSAGLSSLPTSPTWHLSPSTSPAPSTAPSTAPSSAVYQLNFPISAVGSGASLSSKTSMAPSRVVTIGDDLFRTGTALPAPVVSTPASSATYVLDVGLTSGTALSTPDLGISSVQLASSQQQLAARQILASNQHVPLNQGGAMSLGMVPVSTTTAVANVRASKLTISKGLSIANAAVVSNGITAGSLHHVRQSLDSQLPGFGTFRRPSTEIPNSQPQSQPAATEVV